MENKTFIIKYGVYYGIDKYKSGEIKVKNCMSEIHSKIKLENYLKNKIEGFKNMVVYECEEDILNSLNDMFGNIFK